MIGTLPPLKGNAYYCWGLSQAVAKYLPLEFFSFKRLYPNWLYPGGTLDKDPEFALSPSKSYKVHYSLTYYNPFSWVRCAFSATGDVIHAQWWSLPLAPVLFVTLGILRRRKRRILLTVHNVKFHEKTPLDNILTRLVFSQSHEFCVHSEENAEQIAKYMNISLQRIHIVPMPIHDMYSREKIPPETARNKIGINPKEFVVLLFGNLRDYKGIDIFLRSVSLLPARLRRRIDVLIVGQPWNKTQKKYDELIEELGLEDQVKKFLFYVPLSQVKYYFEAADLVALPYKIFDAQSGVGSIALAFGKPLLVTRIGSLPSLVKRPEAIAEPNDELSLRDKMTAILDNPELLEQLAADSIELASKLSWDASAISHLEIYRKLLGDSS